MKDKKIYNAFDKIGKICDEVKRDMKHKDDAFTYACFDPFATLHHYVSGKCICDKCNPKPAVGSKEWAWEQMSNVDQKAMAKSFEKWKIQNDPNLRQVLSQYAIGLATQAIQQRMAADTVGGQMPLPGMGMGGGMGGPQGGGGGQEMMGNMTTGIPNKAQPGSMEAIQNALKSLRGGPMSATQGRGGGGSRV